MHHKTLKNLTVFQVNGTCLFDVSAWYYNSFNSKICFFNYILISPLQDVVGQTLVLQRNKPEIWKASSAICGFEFGQLRAYGKMQKRLVWEEGICSMSISSPCSTGLPSWSLLSSPASCPSSFNGSSPELFCPMRRVRRRKVLRTWSLSTATWAPFLSLPPAMLYGSFDLYLHHEMKEIKEAEQMPWDTTCRCIPATPLGSSLAFLISHCNYITDNSQPGVLRFPSEK